MLGIAYCDVISSINFDFLQSTSLQKIFFPECQTEKILCVDFSSSLYLERPMTCCLPEPKLWRHASSAGREKGPFDSESTSHREIKGEIGNKVFSSFALSDQFREKLAFLVAVAWNSSIVIAMTMSYFSSFLVLKTWGWIGVFASFEFFLCWIES